MSLVYDESRPSALQRSQAQKWREARARLDSKAIKQLKVYVPPVPVLVVDYWPPTYWAIQSEWDIAIPATEPQPVVKTKRPPPDIIYSIREIQDTVCRAAKLGRNDLLSPRRSYNIVNPRHVAVALCRIYTCDSLVGIGKSFNGKDHSTISNSIDKMEPVMEKIKWMLDICPLSRIVEAALQESRRLYPAIISHNGSRP